MKNFVIVLSILIGSAINMSAMANPISIAFNVTVTPEVVSRTVENYPFNPAEALPLQNWMLPEPFQTTVVYVTDRGPEPAITSNYTARMLQGTRRLDWRDAGALTSVSRTGLYGTTVATTASVWDSQWYDSGSAVYFLHSSVYSFIELKPWDGSDLGDGYLKSPAVIDFLTKPFDDSDNRYLGWSESLITMRDGQDGGILSPN
jgi:hypothetical protein